MLTLKDISEKADFLVVAATGESIFMQPDEDSDVIYLERDNGSYFDTLTASTRIDVLIDGNLVIGGREYRAYTSQQLKFDPED